MPSKASTKPAKNREKAITAPVIFQVSRRFGHLTNFSSFQESRKYLPTPAKGLNIIDSGLMIIAKALGNLRFTFFSLNSTPATLAAYLLILGFFEEFSAFLVSLTSFLA